MSTISHCVHHHPWNNQLSLKMKMFVFVPQKSGKYSIRFHGFKAWQQNNFVCLALKLFFFLTLKPQMSWKVSCAICCSYTWLHAWGQTNKEMTRQLDLTFRNNKKYPLMWCSHTVRLKQYCLKTKNNHPPHIISNYSTLNFQRKDSHCLYEPFLPCHNLQC